LRRVWRCWARRVPPLMLCITYTGNDFTTFLFPYTSTDKVTATLTFLNPLAANLSGQTETPTMFTLNDGVITITNQGVSPDFVFTTDAKGNITQWLVSVEDHPSIGVTISITTQNQSGFVGDGGFFELPGCCALGALASNTNNAGVWTGPMNVVPAPAPSNLAGLGMLAVVFLWRRRLQILGPSSDSEKRSSSSW
jgi:hypothetical protein